MTLSRRTVLERLAATSDAERREMTTIAALAATLDADEGTVESYLHGFEACELAHVEPDGDVRVTVTGEEVLELDTDSMVIIDSEPPHAGR